MMMQVKFYGSMGGNENHGAVLVFELCSKKDLFHITEHGPLDEAEAKKVVRLAVGFFR